MSEQVVRLVVDPEATDPYQHALQELRQVLGDDVEVPDPDEAGVIEVKLDATDPEEAVKRVFDAMAASGGDDHFEIAEHPEIPGHWRPREE
jgi:hypothetical protein